MLCVSYTTVCITYIRGALQGPGPRTGECGGSMQQRERKKPLDCRLAIQLLSNSLSSRAASLRGRPVFPFLLCVPTTWCANDGTVDSTTSTPVIESTATSCFSGILPLKHAAKDIRASWEPDLPESGPGAEGPAGISSLLLLFG